MVPRRCLLFGLVLAALLAFFSLMVPSLRHLGSISVMARGIPSSALQILVTAGALAGVTSNPGRTARARWVSSATEA